MKNQTKYWFLEGFNLFKKLGMINMMRICEILDMDNIDKGEVIELNSKDKKNVYFLKKGTIKIVNSLNNHVKYIAKKGNIFGELALYEVDNEIDELAYALEDCIVCYIESDKMELLMQKHKSLKNGVLKIYGLRIKKLERRLNDLLYKDSNTRIQEFIFDYLEEFGENEEHIIKAKNLLTHKDIANLTNTSRQTVNNVMSNLRKQGIITYDTKFVSTTKDALKESKIFIKKL